MRRLLSLFALFALSACGPDWQVTHASADAVRFNYLASYDIAHEIDEIAVRHCAAHGRTAVAVAHDIGSIRDSKTYACR